MREKSMHLSGPTVLSVIWAATLLALITSNSDAQSYTPPAAGEYGGTGHFDVSITTFTNPVYPSANGETLIVSLYHWIALSTIE